MSHYLLNEARFDLPDDLKDRTIHQFVLNDKGPNAFTFVISRAEDITQTSLQEFVDYLELQLRKTLAKFQLQEKRRHQLANAQGMELNYTWRNGSEWMHQRQVAVLVHGPQQQPKALLFTGTCLKQFTVHWNDVFDDMLESMRLEQPWLESTAAAAAAAAAEPAP